MEKKQLLYIVVGLVLLNVVTVFFFMSDRSSLVSMKNDGSGESVATIGNTSITRKDWLLAMENQYGKDVLQQMVDEKVVAQMAKKYDIKVSNEEVNQELMMIKAVHETTDQGILEDEDLLKRKIKANLLFEELITKDVKVTNKQIKNYYDKNQQLYNLPATYRIFHIVTKTKDDAEEVIKELNGGSNFESLAMEKSIDKSTSTQGGDVGYISVESQGFPQNYLDAIQSIKVNNISQPIPYNGGYAVVMVKEKTNGRSFSFNEAKGQIRRQIALESLETPITPESYWKEAKVKWFYGTDN